MISIKYQVHQSNYGWQAPVKDGEIAGSVGCSIPVEALRIVNFDVPGVGIVGYALVSDYGWSAGNIQGEDIGSTGIGKHIEAIKLGLFGENAGQYQLWYRVHVQDIGFMDWVRNGEVSGTENGNKAIEGIQIVLCRSDESVWLASNTTEPFRHITPPQPPATDKREIVMNTASQWVGYLAEDNNVFGVANYCIAFVCNCMRSAGIDFINTAWCDDAKYWAIDRGHWIGDPNAGQRGFPIAFDWDGNGVTNHFGLVESVRSDGGYNTIEANTSGPNGIGIYRKVRYPEDGIEGFINPY